MEAALSFILDPAARRLSEVEMYHWVAHNTPTSAFSQVYESVPWLPGVYLHEVIPTFPRTELHKELARDEVLRLNYREGCCLAVELRTREYRGYVPETRIVNVKGEELELSRAIWTLRGLPYTPVFQTLSEAEMRAFGTYPSLTVVVVLKGEGAPCSISYLTEWDCWALSCKHDSLLVRSSQDIRPEGRWRGVSKFADMWLRETQSLSSELLELLKQRLTGVTLVGEFRTDKALMLKHEPGFMWYAVIDKNDTGVCLPMSTSESLFSPFPFLTHTSRLIPTTAELLPSSLSSLSHEITAGPMHTYGREALVFIESSHTVLTAFQIKNAEFGLYLKLFDALALALRKEVPMTVPLLKMQKEAAGLVSKGLLPEPIDHYEALIRAAFEALETETALFQSDFMAFLEESQRKQIGNTESRPSSSLAIVLITPPLYYTISELKQIQLNLGLAHPVAWEWREALRERPAGVTLYSLHLIPRISDDFDRSALLVFAGFSASGHSISLQRLSEAKRGPSECPSVFSFLQSPDCDSRLNRLISQGTTQSAHLLSLFPDNVLIFPAISHQEIVEIIREKVEFLTKNPIKRVSQFEKPVEKRILRCVLVPLGVPGMGKSSLIPKLREAAVTFDFTLEVISSDSIREQCMKTYMQKNKVFDVNVAFERTAKAAKERFYGLLREVIRNAPRRLVVYLDKNHPPNAIPPLQKELRQWPDLNIVAVFPLCSGFLPAHFPLSVPFLAQCLIRVMRRNDHETLSGPPNKRVEVTLMMYQMFRDFHLEPVASHGFKSVVYIPFTDETMEVPVELGRAIIEAATGVIPKAQPPDAVTERLTELVLEWTEPLPEVDTMPAVLRGLQGVCG